MDPKTEISGTRCCSANAGIEVCGAGTQASEEGHLVPGAVVFCVYKNISPSLPKTFKNKFQTL